MRFKRIPQMPIDGVPIEEIKLDISSRHKLVAILYAIQHLYTTAKPTLDMILETIEADFQKTDKKKLGRIGLSCWENLVLASIRLGCDFTYDHLAEEASNHSKLRLFLGLGKSDEKRYTKSTLQENLNMISTETLYKISDLIVGEGHKESPAAIKKVRGDSFVVKKDIHYPTDSSLLADGIRKTIEISCKIAKSYNLSGWRQHDYHKRNAKRTLRSIVNIARTKPKDKDEQMKSHHLSLLAQARAVIIKAEKTIKEANALIENMPVFLKKEIQVALSELQYFIGATEYVSDLLNRRVINDETIPHSDKVFSLFEPDTQLINRGKRPNPVEFGHRVMVVEDSAGFVLHCRPMGIGFTDEKVVVDVIRELQQRYGNKIQACSFDKGFWTPTNLTELQALVPLVVLPKKGKRSEIDNEREHSRPFGRIRKWHAGVESCIHALVSGNGLDRCRDKSASGYDRYIAMAAIGRNLATLGRLLIEKERKKQKPIRKGLISSNA